MKKEDQNHYKSARCDTRRRFYAQTDNTKHS